MLKLITDVFNLKAFRESSKEESERISKPCFRVYPDHEDVNKWKPIKGAHIGGGDSVEVFPDRKVGNVISRKVAPFEVNLGKAPVSKLRRLEAAFYDRYKSYCADGRKLEAKAAKKAWLDVKKAMRELNL